MSFSFIVTFFMFKILIPMIYTLNEDLHPNLKRFILIDSIDSFFLAKSSIQSDFFLFVLLCTSQILLNSKWEMLI